MLRPLSYDAGGRPRRTVTYEDARPPICFTDEADCANRRSAGRRGTPGAECLVPSRKTPKTTTQIASTAIAVLSWCASGSRQNVRTSAMNVASRMLNCRHTSAMAVLLSACRSAYAICSSLNFDFYFGRSPPTAGHADREHTTRDSELRPAHILWGDVSPIPRMPIARGACAARRRARRVRCLPRCSPRHDWRPPRSSPSPR